MIPRSFLLFAVACATPERPSIAVAPPPPPVALDGAIRATLRVVDANAHLLEVEETVATAGNQEITWRMAVWSPGSYLVREYARQVESLTAVGADGVPRVARKASKNRWVVDAAGTDAVTVRAQIYAAELSVRTSFVSGELAVLSGPSLFLQPLHAETAPWDLRVEGLPGPVETALDPHPDGEPNHLVARDWDELLDSPLVAGSSLATRDFAVEGVPHRLVIVPSDPWDLDRAAKDVEAITRVEAAFWGTIPYDHYRFLVVTHADGGGGLEHLNSSLMFGRRAATRDDVQWKKWLGLVSHELFHAWNVKRLRPAGLDRYDYEAETYTPSLWFAEGVTSYYDDLMLVRAGLITPEEHLERLSSAIESHQRRPGRRVESLTASGFDAWIKHYRPDENQDNARIDYYTKGALAGWLIDARVRAATDDARSLDDAMRLAWTRFPPGTGYTEEALRAVIEEVAGTDLEPWLGTLLDGAEEIDWTPAFDWWGLRFTPPAEVEGPAPVTIGLDKGVTVMRVLRGTAAARAGVEVGDELLAVDGQRIVGGDLDALLTGRAAGEVAELLVARRGLLRTLSVTLEAAPTDTWTLEVDPGRTGAVVRHRATWWQVPPEVEVTP